MQSLFLACRGKFVILILMAKRQKFPTARGFFITGTDTGVGKTVVTGAIARWLVEQSIRVGVFKPIATGCRREREGLVSADAEFLACCSRSEFALAQINPVRYHEPLAPSVAAERSRRDIDWDEIHLSYRNLTQKNDIILVEGIGGVMVPITDDYLVLDLMADLQLPAIIVARPGLGTINHTLLTVNACRARNLEISGIVINRYQADKATLAEETNPRVIAKIARTSILAITPYDKETNVEKGRLGQDALAAIAQANWMDLLSAGYPKKLR
ncbi:MAG: ATP-dependent dethiobiotin synthetase BioD 1 [Planctomycetes bacterium ADurb.Bin412]|nr:MAG: ATP-dependent dethiobiotin synthetase BioD 1 [Planctomycetes bacterium ADurb.Bin412]